MRRETITKRLYGIQKKLLIYTMLLILFTLLLVTSAVSVIMGRNVKDNLVEQYSYVNDRYYNAFQGLYENLEGITENCIINNNIQNSLKNRELSNYDQQVISRTLQFVDGEHIDTYVYMDNKNNVYTRSRETVQAEKLKKSSLYKNMGNEYSRVKFFWEKNPFSEEEEKTLYAARYVRQFDRNYDPGVIYLQMEQSVFGDLAAAAGDDTAAYFIADDKGTLCFSQYSQGETVKKGTRQHIKADIQNALDKTRNGENNREGKALSGDEGLIYISRHEVTGFSVITFVPNAVVYRSLWQMQSVIVLIFLLVLGLAFLLGRYFAGQITQPIRYISELMENFDDSRLSCEAVLYTNTELDGIGSSYNKMLGRISGLIEQVSFKERELWKAELDTLLYQIQPHFLYNTLDTVYMLARISKEETIMKMIQSLSKYLRINLSNGAEEITIEEELQHVRAYLDIQNIRNSGLFTYDFSVDDSVRHLPVMKMILQPVAENCIKHAFEQDTVNPAIWIAVKEMEEDVVFTVENNGKLMSEKAKHRLNRLETVDTSDIDSMITKEKGGYGIWNVVKRLRLRYQEQIRFYYVVSAHKTCCIIKIKKQLLQEKEKNHEE